MVRNGWIDEVRSLLGRGYDPSCPGLRTIGYPEIVALARGEIGKREAVGRIQELTRQYAKRQMTWFRKEKDVRWFDAQGDLVLESALLLARSDMENGGGVLNES